jgi:hypothetical protein
MVEKKLNTKQKAAVSAVERVLLARRSGNLKREQSEYEKFEKLCEKYNLDPYDTMNTAKSYIRAKTINSKGL